MSEVNNPEVENNQGPGASSASDEDPILDLYLESAKDLVQCLSNPIDKETCLVWVDFIKAHKATVPALSDYIVLLLFSLHKEVRAPPFDQLPPPLENFSHDKIDLFSMGEVILKANREFDEQKSKVQSSSKSKGPACKDSIPVLEWGSGGDTMDYLATQKIPGFGRQCYYATSSKDLPFWWPPPSEEGDYLSRIAQYMEWQREKGMKLGECDPVLESITKNGWTENAKKLRVKESHDSAYGFKWHKLSRLPLARAPFDKKGIREFMKIAESKGKEILQMDEQADGLHDRTFVDTDKLSFSPEYRSIFSKRSHGTVSPSKTMVTDMEERKREREYNTSWAAAVDDEPNLEGIANESDKFMRKVNENALQRMLRTSTGERNFEDEANISNLKRIYETSRSGDRPPPPSPEDGSSSDILRRGVSWNIPAFRQTCSDTGREDRTQMTTPSRSPCERVSANRTYRPSDYSESKYHHPDSSRGQRTPSSAFQNQSAVSRPNSSRNAEYGPPYLSETMSYSRHSPDLSNQDRSYRADLQRSQRSLPEKRVGNHCRPCASKSYAGYNGSSFPDLMNKTNPVDKSVRLSQREQANQNHGSFTVDNPDEFDPFDLYLVPTASEFSNDDIEENILDYEDVDPDWVYDPRGTSGNFESVIPGMNFQEDRREGQLFVPRDRNLPLGPIDWPEQEHIHDINTSFPEGDSPFSFLDENQARSEIEGCVEYSPQRWRPLTQVADILGPANILDNTRY